jgi:hypothetical protein
MSSPSAELLGFAYGEHLEGVPPRSLGFRLLAPVEPEPWTGEVEALARRLQAAPYPDVWPPAEVFCSVLLSSGHRLIALARYGLADHTASQRRGGLELLGVVAPGKLGAPSALAVYRWLRQRRAATDDLRRFAGRYALAEILAAVPVTRECGNGPLLSPARLGEPGTWLFAARQPQEPDTQLTLLEAGTGPTWQWLPFVGPDFPLETFAQHGPLIAWTPHAVGPNVRVVGHKEASQLRIARQRRLLQLVVGLILIVLLIANLWATWTVYRRGTPAQQTAAESSPRDKAAGTANQTSVPLSSDEVALALGRLLQKQHALAEWTRPQLREQYEKMAKQDDRLRVSTPEGKAALGAIGLLARRNSDGIEADIRAALLSKGYDPELVNLACRRIHEKLVAVNPDGS